MTFPTTSLLAVVLCLGAAGHASAQVPSGPAAPGSPVAVAVPAAAGLRVIAHPPVVTAPSVACADVTFVVGPPCAPVRHPTVIPGPNPAAGRAATDVVAAYVPADVPASNPLVAPVPGHPPAGWRRVWDDGRINFRRGLPERYSVPVATAVLDCGCR